MKSIWDGWEKQAYGSWCTDDGAKCALGYLDGYWFRGSREVKFETRRRVANYIKANYPMRWGFKDQWGNTLEDYEGDILIYANNTLQLTPDDFRRIDHETQIAEGMPAVEALVNSVDVPVKP